MHTFLKDTLKALLSRDYQHVHFVVGNTSSDLDSMVGSQALAYHLSQKESHSLYVPVVNSPQAMMATRFDCLMMLSRLDIPLESILFREQFMQ